MRISGRHGRHGRLRMALEPAEVSALSNLLDELDTLLIGDTGAAAGGHAGDPVMARLFPPAYRDDPEAAAEYRELTESGLRAERRERIASCRADLRDAEVDLGDPDAARRWIQVLNDLRLALGTRLGITGDDSDGSDGSDDSDDSAVDVDDPDQQARIVYHWLTYVQDAVVSALMRAGR